MSLTVVNGTATRLGKSVLDNVSVEITPGRVLAIIGANGAGKSSLIKVAAGDLKLARGSVTLGGKPLADWSIKQRAQVRAVLPQTSDAAMGFRVSDLVLLGRIPHNGGVATCSDHSIAARCLEAVDASHLAGRVYSTLSGGEQQRIHIARVFTQIWVPSQQKPCRYLLLDEPTTALDLCHQHEILGLVRRLARKNVGVAVVLHDLNLAARYADRICLLDHGRSVSIGTPDEVLNAKTIAGALGIRVAVRRHPDFDCPLVLYLGKTGSRLPPTHQNTMEEIAV